MFVKGHQDREREREREQRKTNISVALFQRQIVRYIKKKKKKVIEREEKRKGAGEGNRKRLEPPADGDVWPRFQSLNFLSILVYLQFDIEITSPIRLKLKHRQKKKSIWLVKFDYFTLI